MDQLDTSATNLDLDIDLESGGTSDEDGNKNQILSSPNSMNFVDSKNSEFVSPEPRRGTAKVVDCSYPPDKYILSDEISAKNQERMKMIRANMINYVDKMMNKENPERHSSGKPSKPPRPPRGPSLDASDMRLLKEISELNLKRKRMERTRTLKKIKKEKASSISSNLIACLVTIIFFLVIIFQGLLGSRV